MKNLVFIAVLAAVVYFVINKDSSCTSFEDVESKRNDLLAKVRDIISEKDMSRLFSLKQMQSEQTSIDDAFSKHYSGVKIISDYQGFCQRIQNHMDLL